MFLLHRYHDASSFKLLFSVAAQPGSGKCQTWSECQIVVFFMRRLIHIIYEPVHEKTNNLGFRPGLTQTGLYDHRRWLEAWNFGFKKKKDCTIRAAKIKALISFAVTAKLICTFVFAQAFCWFSYTVAHICYIKVTVSQNIAFFMTQKHYICQQSILIRHLKFKGDNSCSPEAKQWFGWPKLMHNDEIVWNALSIIMLKRSLIMLKRSLIMLKEALSCLKEALSCLKVAMMV